jgi:hypothetical protein
LNYIFNNLIGLWRIKKSISTNTFATGIAFIKKNKLQDLILQEKFNTNLNGDNAIFGENKFLIKRKKKELQFFFNTGPNSGNLFQKFKLNKKTDISFYYCLKDTYQTTLYWVNQNYFRITHIIKKKSSKRFFINSHYYKTNNIRLFDKFI